MVKVAIVGGTGHLGKAIARRLVKAGHEVSIGSREVDRARTAAAELGAARHGLNVDIVDNQDIVIVSVPYSSQAETLSQVRGHVGRAIVVDTTVPLTPPKVMRIQLPTAGSAAAEARELLGPDVRLVTAFHNVAAHTLATDELVECDVLVFSDDVEARDAVIALCGDMRLRGLSGGVLTNSAAAEALTSILIYMNKTYKADGAGIRFTRLVGAPTPT